MLDLARPKFVELALGELKKRVTYHDPCMLGRYSRIFDQPRLLLDAVAELQLLEMAENRERALCCGSSAWVYCGAVNREIQRERLAQAEATGADILVTSCPKCQILLRCAQKGIADGISQIEIRDLSYLAAQSLSKEAD